MTASITRDYKRSIGEGLKVVWGQPGKITRGGSVMSIFRRPDYRSDATLFIDELKAKRPYLENQQIAGRALLWDKSIDRQAQQEACAARVPQKPYVYQTKV